jgi:HPr kinase/phosphorylase
MKKSILHGTAVERGGEAVFLCGPSGSGKSDLAFRLIMGHGFILVADDQVEFRLRLDRPHAHAVTPIEGLLEMRGVGLVKFDPAHSAALKLVVDLVPRESVPRLPDWGSAEIAGVSVPRLALHAFDASTPLKILKAMELVDRPDLLVK